MTEKIAKENLGMEKKFLFHTPLMFLSKAETWELSYTIGGEKFINIIKKYSDYQSVEGILFPQKITQNMGYQKINFKVTSISLNEQLSEDEFE